MKAIIKIFRKACSRCYGMTVIELPNGDTKTCPLCLGRGMN